ncbi:carboxypeptidase-like regulatory domain-containing protein [Spongiivirga sp. MCCC 1A20706]|uniref:carboxypeptidase-like regulatory domain-containing protein n=1 Tax=Spongiivirga sp. MCCC 1A20706 TaxID=3160963 RepID=UPI00397744DF
MLRHLIIIITILSLSSCIHAQSVQGVVTDLVSGDPLEGVSVYFDDTTVGTVTGPKGRFKLSYNKNLTTPLVISYIGYQTITFSQVNDRQFLRIEMEEKIVPLSEVILSPNDWTRDVKLNQFKTHYLGNTDNGKSCTILNEDDLVLTYLEKDKKLVAFCKDPLIIVNDRLKYQITVRLHKFELIYGSANPDKNKFNVKNVSYAGHSFYSTLERLTTPETQRRRMETYQGSKMHFLRAVVNNKVSKEGFRLFRRDSKLKLSPRRVIGVRKENGVNAIKISDILVIQYKNLPHSKISTYSNEIYVDDFGNYYPVDQMYFEGHMGAQRMGDTLPHDFLLDDI